MHAASAIMQRAKKKYCFKLKSFGGEIYCEKRKYANKINGPTVRVVINPLAKFS